MVKPMKLSDGLTGSAVAMCTLFSLLMLGCSGAAFTSGEGAKKSANAPGGTNAPCTGECTPGSGLNSISAGNINQNAGGTPVPPGGTLPPVPIPPQTKEKIGGLTDQQFNGSLLVKDFQASIRDIFYIVTMNGKAYYYAMEGATAKDINDAKIVEKKQWSFPIAGQGGNRTYVTEGGLVFVRSGGRVFWIDPLKTPEGPLDMTPGGPNYFQIAGVDDGFRGCPVSYMIGEQRYVGVGYAMGSFAIFTQDITPPYKPIWGTLDNKYTATVKNTVNGWGYSCYIDQTRMIYYGQYEAGSPSAFNLASKQQVDVAASAPNGPQVYTGPATDGPYAMGGDRQGNVFDLSGNGVNGDTSSGNFHYTFSADAGKSAVWETMYTGQLRIVPTSCLTSGTGCDNPYSYDTVGQLGLAIGPMSALPSTGVIASQKFGSDIYFMRLKDANNLAAGIEVKHLDKVDGTVYMYDDFTGATLYSDNSLVTYNLKDNKTFSDGTPLAVLILTWEAAAGQSTIWQDLKLMVRCYKDGDFPPNFAEVSGVSDAGLRTFVEVGSCRNTAADKVDVQVVQLNGASTIGRIKDIKVNFYQGN